MKRMATRSPRFNLPAQRDEVPEKPGANPPEHSANPIGATRHRPPALIGRVSGHGFQPTDATIALQNLNVMTVDQRFNLPDNIRVRFADEDKGVAGHKPLRIELINPISGHDGGAPRRYTRLPNAVSDEKCLCRIEHFVATLFEKLFSQTKEPLAALGGGGRRTCTAQPTAVRHHADRGSSRGCQGS
jgi:hypothetical protein